MHRYTSIVARARAWRWLVVFGALCLCGSARADAPGPLSWPSTVEARAPLREHLAVLVDRAHALTPRSVLAGKVDAEFQPATARNTNFGFTDAEVWARFAVRYGTDHGAPPILVLPRPLTDRLDLFSVDAAGQVGQVTSGDVYPFATRPIVYRGFAFLLEPRPGETITYYLRVRSETGAISLPLELMSAPAFRALSGSENFLRGAFIGFLVGLALCALALFALVRNSAYAYYCQYLVAFGLLMSAFDGYAMQFLWPDAPLAQQVLPTALLALTNVTGTLFARSFLNLPRLTPAFETPFALLCATSALGMALHLFHHGPLGVQVMVLSSLGLSGLALAGSLAAWRAGDRVARYLFAGWVAFLVGMLVSLGDMLGMRGASPAAADAVYFGALGEFVALATGLTERLWRVQRAREAEVAAANADLAELNANLEKMVQARTRELEARNRELSELAVRDSLTGLYNHSTSIELLEQLLQQSGRYEFPVAIVMLDLDNFKQLNDTYGHQLGDHVLEEVSQTLLDSVRGSDVVGRYGGEEFLIVLSHADIIAAREYGERLLARIREIRAGERGISASLGISVFHPRGHRGSALDVIRRADEALYRSKREGRDRLTVDSLSLVLGRETERRADKLPPRS